MKEEKRNGRPPVAPSAGSPPTGCFAKTRAERVGRKLLRRGKSAGFIIILSLLIVGCGLNNMVNFHSWISYVTGRGNPPAQKLVWSRNEMNKILVTASESGFGKSQVFGLDISTGEREMFAESSYGIISGEAWSPDETRLILEIDPGSAGYEKTSGLWIWDATANSPTQFLGNGGLAIWSPNGNNIAVFETKDGMQTISLWDVESKSKQSISVGESISIGDIVGADWSPDEERLALAMGNPRSSIDQYLYIFDINSKSLSRLTNEGDVYDVAWSPLGNQIAYVRHARGTGSDSLHLINVDGTCDREIPGVKWIRSLAWSPDGSKIAFIGSDGIYSVDVAAYSTEHGQNSSCH